MVIQTLAAKLGVVTGLFIHKEQQLPSYFLVDMSLKNTFQWQESI